MLNGYGKIPIIKRRGFLKIAFKKKVKVIPVFVKNENKLFIQFTNYYLTKIQKQSIKYIGYPFPIFAFGPFRKNLSIIFGNMIDPSQCKDLSNFQDCYYDHLVEIINKYDDNPENINIIDKQKQKQKQK